jgi:peptidoglycan/LPS O-acetylase OafA/YrhL
MGMSVISIHGSSAALTPEAAPKTASARAAAATAISRPRNEAIDAFRLIAAAAIVFVHAVESPSLDNKAHFFRFAVPFFLFASLYFQSLSLRRNSGRGVLQIISGRVVRLYVPFLAWSAIYLLSRDLKRALLLHIPPVAPRLTMLWTGTEYHLWFLPFLLAWSIVLVTVQRCLIARDARWRWVVMGVALATACTMSCFRMPAMPPATEMTYDSPRVPALEWFESTPTGCAALAFACAMALGPVAYSVPAYVGLGGLLLAIGCCIEQAINGIQMGPRALTGLGCMLLTLVPWKTRVIPAMAKIGRRGYGIYLCHVLPVELIHALSHKCQLDPSPSLDVATWALSFLGAWGLVVLFEKSPKTAWLNG